MLKGQFLLLRCLQQEEVRLRVVWCDSQPPKPTAAPPDLTAHETQAMHTAHLPTHPPTHVAIRPPAPNHPAHIHTQNALPFH